MPATIRARRTGFSRRRPASDDSARSTAYWALAEAHWLGGRSEEAIAASDRALELPIGSYPGRANAVLIGQWARADQGLPVDPRAEAALANTAPDEAGAIGTNCVA